MMKEKIIMLFVCVGIAVSTWAIPARRGYQTVQNSDGTTLTITLCGDETFHFYVDENGRPVKKNEAGDWVADTRNVDSLWTVSNVKRDQHRKALIKKTRQMVKADKSKNAKDVITRRGLLILVNYQNKAMVNGDHSHAIFEQMMNSLNNPYGSNYGSVREYFRDQSYGLFDIEFDVVGPVTVSHPYAYYGANDSNGDDMRPGEMVIEACKLVDDAVDFAAYDWDGDGEVENIYVTYAGYGEAATGADDNTIWPHQWSITEATSVYNSRGIITQQGQPLTLDGVKIDTYACGPELAGIRGTTLEGIGTMCHEYSHCLGLMDFYDTSYSRYVGMDAWSLMDYGTYNGNGYHPAGFTAYERWFCGWLEPIELNQPTSISGMPNIEENPVAYVVYNDNRSKDIEGEYYLLANHQKVGWDQKAYGHGMMVLHVDYDDNAWRTNSINTISNHQRMTLIPADNSMRNYADDGDLWPGSRGKTELTDTSTPAATLYSVNTDGTKLMHKPIEDITEINGQISFSFMGGEEVEVPVIDEALSSVNGTTVNVAWDNVSTAASYNLRYTVYDPTSIPEYRDAKEAMTLREDFAKLTDFRDGTREITELDDYMSTPGWTGSKVFVGMYGAKLGTSKASGTLTSPSLSCTTGQVTIYLVSYLYGIDNTILFVSIEGSKEGTQQVMPITSEGGKAAALTFTDVPATYKVTIETTIQNRAYINLFGAFDGTFTYDDIIASYTEGGPTLKGETTVITGITESLYTLTGMAKGNVVKVEVQTVDAKGNPSAWSNSISFGITDDISHLSAERPASDHSVYDLTGRPVGSGKLRPGFYLIHGRTVYVR